MPYVSHLLAVAALVLEAGADEDVAIAALLHDALEDTDLTADEIAAQFGARVASIVEACSDTTVQPKPPWRPRKEAYLARLRTEDDDVLLVSLADKLHNARSMVADLEQVGPTVWSRFNAGPAEQLWWYRSLVAVFESRRPGPMADELARAVDRLADLASGDD